MSTRSYNAYKEICRKRVEDHQIKTYGMLPITARFDGKCGCGRIHPAGTCVGYGYTLATDTPCKFTRGTQIVKFRGSWWNVSCVERVLQEEFRASAKFVLEDVCKRRDGSIKYIPKAWTNDPAEAAKWREMLDDMERIVERG
jgi:hypothetical protein